MNAVFADSHYLIGLLNRADEAHDRCRQFSRSFSGRLLTTDYVLLEFADAMSAPRHRGPAGRFMAQLKGSEVDTVSRLRMRSSGRGWPCSKAVPTRTGR